MSSDKHRIVPLLTCMMTTIILTIQMGGCTDMAGTLFGGATLTGVTNVTPAEAHNLIQAKNSDADFIILDVRTPSEYAGGHIEGAVNVCSTCETPFANALASLDTGNTYLVHCGSGHRSTIAIQVMQDVGFTNIYHLATGLNQWTADGYPTVQSE